MAVVGDARVTEMLTPLVSLTTALLTPQFLQVSVQIRGPRLQRFKARVINLVMYV